MGCWWALTLSNRRGTPCKHQVSNSSFYYILCLDNLIENIRQTGLPGNQDSATEAEDGHEAKVSPEDRFLAETGESSIVSRGVSGVVWVARSLDIASIDRPVSIRQVGLTAGGGGADDHLLLGVAVGAHSIDGGATVSPTQGKDGSGVVFVVCWVDKSRLAGLRYTEIGTER